jgi:hypothetical protein
MNNFLINSSPILCPKCNKPMKLRGTADLPIPSGTYSGTASITSISASGSSVYQSWNVYYCENCGFEFKALDSFNGD